MDSDQLRAMHVVLARIARALEIQNKLTTRLLDMDERHWRQAYGMTHDEVQAEMQRDAEKRKEHKTHGNTT